MNILIIFVLIFTFTLKANGADCDNAAATENVTSIFPGCMPTSDGNMTSNPTFTSTTEMHVTVNTPSISNLTNTSTILSKSENKADRDGKMLNNCNETNKQLEQKVEGSFKLNLVMILVFILGVICSTIIFSTVLCFVVICDRCRKTDANTDKEGITLEGVRSGNDQLMMQSDEDQADEQAPLQVQSPVEVSTNTSEINSGTKEEMKISGTEQTEGAGEVNEVDYASINYSLLQKKDNGGLKPQKVESDYAEIQLKKMSEGEEVETLQDGEKQGGEKQDDVKKHEVNQDGVNQGLDVVTESQKQVELQEVQV
ncbi:uncharacterized protein LOC128621537 isoform X1 [Ictalurus furcatus]|uniref:uncharacterized protein LOC128621537 isoform X1 n=1 Tax=Ictalurus furcatus TaxID=66913 RepID=UPI0023504FF0|nr:uncharacterized protein LOC128621537 isoform X1 [Ictalurus furcatus]